VLVRGVDRQLLDACSLLAPRAPMSATHREVGRYCRSGN
jgi:hypothetical protein